MTPQAGQTTVPSNEHRITSRHWDTHIVGGSGSLYHKSTGNSFDHGRAVPATTPSLAGLPSPDRGQLKRKYVDDGTFRFGDESSAAGVKEEPRDDEHASRAATLTRHFSVTKTNQRLSAVKTTSSGPRTRETTQASSMTPSDPQERSAIVATLVHVWDSPVTAAAVALVLRWARHPTLSCHGDIYDTTFIRDIIADLDVQGIDADRRASVIAMLARPLQQQLDSLRSSSESLSLCLASLTTPQPSSPLSKHPSG